jgi:hypothetical protein
MVVSEAGVVASSCVCLVMVASAMGCWRSCPPRSHLAAGGGEQSRKVSMAELGGATGGSLVMVDINSDGGVLSADGCFLMAQPLPFTSGIVGSCRRLRV